METSAAFDCFKAPPWRAAADAHSNRRAGVQNRHSEVESTVLDLLVWCLTGKSAHCSTNTSSMRGNLSEILEEMARVRRATRQIAKFGLVSVAQETTNSARAVKGEEMVSTAINQVPAVVSRTCRFPAVASPPTTVGAQGLSIHFAEMVRATSLSKTSKSNCLQKKRHLHNTECNPAAIAGGMK